VCSGLELCRLREGVGRFGGVGPSRLGGESCKGICSWKGGGVSAGGRVVAGGLCRLRVSTRVELDGQVGFFGRRILRYKERIGSVSLWNGCQEVSFLFHEWTLDMV